mmetsp:Transcript_81220/g.246431  ORF Transcript_81220/g.246431 Transcript_81220/m.246431 type:complete len:254 (+) Transcript_81220:222-983(+)
MKLAASAHCVPLEQASITVMYVIALGSSLPQRMPSRRPSVRCHLRARAKTPIAVVHIATSDPTIAELSPSNKLSACAQCCPLEHAVITALSATGFASSRPLRIWLSNANACLHCKSLQQATSTALYVGIVDSNPLRLKAWNSATAEAHRPLLRQLPTTAPYVVASGLSLHCRATSSRCRAHSQWWPCSRAPITALCVVRSGCGGIRCISRSKPKASDHASALAQARIVPRHRSASGMRSSRRRCCNSSSASAQ